MEAFILAAGLGTRLRPLTDDRPKALVDINGKPLLDITLQRLMAAGVKRCVVNVHYFGDMLIDYLQRHTWPFEVVISDEREQLLNTGGALKHAAPLFSGTEPVLVHNVDILSDIDFQALERHHLECGNLVTLCTSHRTTKRMLLFDAAGHIVARCGTVDATGLTPMAFSGVSMVSPALFPLLPPDDHPYPAIDTYLDLARRHPIGSFVHPYDHWLDVGTPEAVEKAKNII